MTIAGPTVPTRDEYRVERYSNIHYRGVLALQTHLWGGDSDIRERYFHWKYRENPYCTEPLLFLALRGDQVIGVRGLFFGRWRFGEQWLTVPAFADSVVEPDSRRRGIADAITRAALNECTALGYTMVMSNSTSEAMYDLFTGLGAHTIGAIEGINIFPDQCSRETLRKVNRDKRGDGVLIENTPRASEMAELVIQSDNQYVIGHDRSVDYYLWRFRNPRRDYTYLYCMESGTLHGFLVIQTLPGAPPERGRIVDWRAASLSVYAKLIEHLVGSRIARSYVLWNSGLTDEMHRLNRSAGFRYRQHDRRPTVLYSIIGSSESLPAQTLSRMHDQQYWDLRMADADGY